MTKKFNGFTLAEVLVTLGIIGVVAAMTMPTLINQTNGAQYKAAYKKALSALSQAITLNVALEDISFADLTTDTDATKLENVLPKRMNVVSTTKPSDYTIPSVNAEFKHTCTTTEVAETSTDTDCKGKTANTEVTKTKTLSDLDRYLFFNDSSMFAYKADDAKTCTTSTPCYGVIDVNGAKGPNKVTTNASSPTDIYPVVFYDQTILPASEVASQVLYAK